jgi:hypothetical protein
MLDETILLTNMKKILIILALLLPPAEGIVAQMRYRKLPPPPIRYQHSREPRQVEKRDELSKKLMERKNELRKEDRRQDQRAREVKPRSQ